MSETILHTKKFWLTKDGRIDVYDYRVANKLNKVLKSYEGGKYVFRAGEETFFRVPPNHIHLILSVVSPHSLKDN